MLGYFDICPNPKCLSKERVRIYTICRGSFQVECGKCGMRGPSGYDESDACEKWNALFRSETELSIAIKNFGIACREFVTTWYRVWKNL